jgi:hypothetical protein
MLWGGCTEKTRDLAGLGNRGEEGGGGARRRRGKTYSSASRVWFGVFDMIG